MLDYSSFPNEYITELDMIAEIEYNNNYQKNHINIKELYMNKPILKIIFTAVLLFLAIFSVIVFINSLQALISINGHSTLPDSFWTKERAIFAIIISAVIFVASVFMTIYLTFGIMKQLKK
jgi:hypothetical protein